MTTIEIHYQSPESDPLKVPRPHFAEISVDKIIQVDPRTGEIGPVGNLIGFSQTTTPGYDFYEPNFYWPEVLLDEAFNLDLLAGYYAQFSGTHGDMFGYTEKIERVVID